MYKNAPANCMTSVTSRNLSISESILSNLHSVNEVHHFGIPESRSVELFQSGSATNVEQSGKKAFYFLSFFSFFALEWETLI